MFGRSVPEPRKITQCGINHVFNNHRFRLQNWNQPFLSAENLASYASAIHSKGAPFQICFGFIDGTVRYRPECTSTVQSVFLPNRLIANFSGPWNNIFSIILYVFGNVKLFFRY